MEIKSRLAAGPEDQDMVEAGMTPDQIKAAKQQRVLQNAYGKLDAKTGKRWSLTGAQEDIPGANKDTQTERQSRIIAKTGQAQLDNAINYFESNGGIVGTVKQIAGDQWSVPVPGVGSVNMGGFGDAGQAFKSARMGIIDLAFALSGKSVSNAERKEFLDLYLPSSLDSTKRQVWKLNQAKRYFDNVRNAKDDEERRAITQEAIRNGQVGDDAENGSKNPARLPAPDRSDPRGLSDQELLRRLQQ
jgi:hypothetical protein